MNGAMSHGDIAHNRARNLAHEFAHDLARARTLVDDFLHSHELDAELEGRLVRDLAHADDLAARLDPAADLDSAVRLGRMFYTDLGRVRAFIGVLAWDLGRAQERVRARDRNQRRTASRAENRIMASHDSPTVGDSALPGGVPRCLVALAVQVLPLPNRPRYAEELCVELVDLPSPARLSYALRVLGGAWRLRRALTELEPPDGSLACQAMER